MFWLEKTTCYMALRMLLENNGKSKTSLKENSTGSVSLKLPTFIHVFVRACMHDVAKFQKNLLDLPICSGCSSLTS